MTSLFKQPLNVINVGIEMFSDDLKTTCSGHTFKLTPPGQGNVAVIRALDQIEGNTALQEKIAGRQCSSA